MNSYVWGFKKLLSLLLSLFIINSCQSQSEYDPELMKPDNYDTGMSHGFTLTPLGCFLYFPWEYEIVRTDNLEDKKIFRSNTFREIKENLVFEF